MSGVDKYYNGTTATTAVLFSQWRTPDNGLYKKTYGANYKTLTLKKYRPNHKKPKP